MSGLPPAAEASAGPPNRIIKEGRNEVRAIVRDEPPPVKNDRACIQDLVIADIEARKAVGLERYGTLLQPFNGRDALMDAYAEALDLCQYLRQVIEERNEARGVSVHIANG